MLFGQDTKAFKYKIEDLTIVELKLAHWRKKGPISKLYNIVY